MALERLIINNKVVKEHAIACSHLRTLHTISWRDYRPIDYFSEPPQIEALDLDGYEKSLRKKQSNCSEDAAIGVAVDYQCGRFVSPRLLCIELRMNYKHGDNISLTSLLNKVDHSKALLLDGSCVLHDKHYFVFTPHVVEQAKRCLRDEAQAMGRMSECCVVSVDEMKKILVDPATLPYVPIHSREEIQSSLESIVKGVKQIDVPKLLAQLMFWKNELQSAYNSYNVDELNHMLETIEPIISPLPKISEYKQLMDDEQIIIEIAIEEILNFKNFL